MSPSVTLSLINSFQSLTLGFIVYGALVMSTFSLNLTFPVFTIPLLPLQSRTNTPYSNLTTREKTRHRWRADSRPTLSLQLIAHLREMHTVRYGKIERRFKRDPEHFLRRLVEVLEAYESTLPPEEV
jgi:hypothetical protein